MKPMYADQKQLSVDEQKIVKEHIDLGTSTKQLKKLIKTKLGKNVHSQDVHNIRYQYRRELIGDRSQSELVVEKLHNLAKENPDMIIHLDLDDHNGLNMLMVQSKTMHDLYSKYPEVLFVDGTYKLNVEEYPLYPIMCQDGNGKGRPVAYFWVKNEKESTFHKSCIGNSKSSTNFLCKICL